MPVRRIVVTLAVVLAPRLASAQFATRGEDVEEPAEPPADDTEIRGRVSTSGVYYGESSAEGASPQRLLYTDVRGRVEAEHIEGGAWAALGDLRLRLAADDRAARGWLGGNEVDLKELSATRRGATVDLTLGRLIVREADATTIDGVRVAWRAAPEWELGGFAGMFPSPFARSLEHDYAADDANLRGVTGLPVAAGSWAGYRYRTVHGSVGAAAILPRDADPTEPDPTRVFVTSQGYWRLGKGTDVFHYGVFDLAGEAGAQLLNLQLGLHWRPAPRLLVEGGYSHMSTYALALYVRDLLEEPSTIAGAPPQQNLVLMRMGADEARAGANYTFLEQRVDVHGELRYRRRESIAPDDPLLPPELADLPADTQWDLSAGVRQRRSLGGWTLGANATLIRGDRTSSTFGTLRGTRTFWGDRLDLDADVTYIDYADACSATDPTCTGTSSGATFRAGATLVYRRDRHWLALADYHLALNSSRSATTVRPDLTSHTLFARIQYSF